MLLIGRVALNPWAASTTTRPTPWPAIAALALAAPGTTIHTAMLQTQLFF